MKTNIILYKYYILHLQEVPSYWDLRLLGFYKKRFFILFEISKFRSSRPEVLCKKVFLEISQSWQESTCTKVSFLKSFLIKFFSINFIKKGTLSQVLTCEFCEISKNTFSYPSGGCFCKFNLYLPRASLTFPLAL